MPSYINNPIKNNKWDPSKGDYYSKNIHNEDLLIKKKVTKKKALILFLTLSHILLLLLILTLY